MSRLTLSSLEERMWREAASRDQRVKPVRLFFNYSDLILLYFSCWMILPSITVSEEESNSLSKVV